MIRTPTVAPLFWGYTHIHTPHWYFQAPERPDSRVSNHLVATVCCVFGAPGTKIQTISVLALALESVGEDSSPTLSWPHFLDTWLMASFSGLVRASVKILRPRSHGLNFWPPESVDEDFFIDGLVAPPSSSVVLCSKTSPPFLGHLQPSARANSRRENHGRTT